MYHGGAAVRVIMSRDPMCRQHAETRPRSKWVHPVVTAELVNTPKVGAIPAACDGADFDPKVYPGGRTDRLLRAMSTDVRSFRELFMVFIERCCLRCIGQTCCTSNCAVEPI